MASMGTPDPEEVVTALHRFGLERDRLRTALSRRLGVAAADLDALEHLELGGALSQRELTERLLLTSGAVTQLVDRLERMRPVTPRAPPPPPPPPPGGLAPAPPRPTAASPWWSWPPTPNSPTCPNSAATTKSHAAPRASYPRPAALTSHASWPTSPTLQPQQPNSYPRSPTPGRRPRRVPPEASRPSGRCPTNGVSSVSG